MPRSGTSEGVRPPAPVLQQWRTIASSDDAYLSSLRQQILGRQYVPARNGEEHVCQLVMEQVRLFRTGPAGKPLK